MGCLRQADALPFANWMILEARIRAGETGAGLPASTELLRLAQSYAVQFGGTPAARSRIEVKKADEKQENWA
jgi:hypothetical protein